MMTKNIGNQRDQLEMLTIDQLVPEYHLVRKLDAAIDFSFIYPLVEDLYSSTGRPSIDPVVLIKMTFLQYTFGIRSMRQTIKEIETNMAYRWFLGFGFHSEVPHFSTFGKNYVRRFADTDLFEQIFYRILKEIMDQGLLSSEHVFVDSTHVKASANKRKFTKKTVRKEARAYEDKLQLELNLDRQEHGKRPFSPDSFEKEEFKEIKESTTDPESGYYVKDERTKQFAYSFHAAKPQKLIQRHIWEDYLELSEDLRHHHEIKEVYNRRKKTIERVFADAKEKHGMRWTTLRGIKKLSMQALLTFAAMNLKKLATWTWKGPQMA